MNFPASFRAKQINFVEALRTFNIKGFLHLATEALSHEQFGSLLIVNFAEAYASVRFRSNHDKAACFRYSLIGYPNRFITKSLL